MLQLIGLTRPVRARFVVLAALSAAGCSINTYKPQVDGFATAAGKASDAYAAMQATVLTARTESLKKDLIAGSRPPRFHEGPNASGVRSLDCGPTSERCRLDVLVDGELQPLVPEFHNITRLLQEITSYAANLQAIVNSDAAQQVTANLGAAGGSIKNLATEIAKQTGNNQVLTEVGAFAVPSANLAAWIAGEYINLIQVAALRTATRDANPVIQDTKVVLEGAARTAINTTRTALSVQVRAIHREYEHASSSADKARILDRLVTAASAYDQALLATSGSVFADMTAAHEKLTNHLSGQDVSLAEVSAAIGQFVTQATALHDIVLQLQAAQKQVAAAKK